MRHARAKNYNDLPRVDIIEDITRARVPVQQSNLTPLRPGKNSQGYFIPLGTVILGKSGPL